MRLYVIYIYVCILYIFTCIYICDMVHFWTPSIAASIIYAYWKPQRDSHSKVRIALLSGLSGQTEQQDMCDYQKDQPENLVQTGMNQVALSPLNKRQYEAPAKFVREIKLNLYWYTVMQPVCRNLLGITNFYIAVAGFPSSTWVISRSLTAVLPITQVILDCIKQVTASR